MRSLQAKHQSARNQLHRDTQLTSVQLHLQLLLPLPELIPLGARFQQAANKRRHRPSCRCSSKLVAGSSEKRLERLNLQDVVMRTERLAAGQQQ